MPLKLAPAGTAISTYGWRAVVADALDEQQHRPVVLGLAGIHAPAQLIANKGINILDEPARLS